MSKEFWDCWLYDKQRQRGVSPCLLRHRRPLHLLHPGKRWSEIYFWERLQANEWEKQFRQICCWPPTVLEGTCHHGSCYSADFYCLHIPAQVDHKTTLIYFYGFNFVSLLSSWRMVLDAKVEVRPRDRNQELLVCFDRSSSVMGCGYTIFLFHVLLLVTNLIGSVHYGSCLRFRFIKFKNHFTTNIVLFMRSCILYYVDCNNYIPL